MTDEEISRATLHAILAAGVDYVLGGGFAVIAHTFPRTTRTQHPRRARHSNRPRTFGTLVCATRNAGTVGGSASVHSAGPVEKPKIAVISALLIVRPRVQHACWRLQ